MAEVIERICGNVEVPFAMPIEASISCSVGMIPTPAISNYWCLREVTLSAWCDSCVLQELNLLSASLRKVVGQAG